MAKKKVSNKVPSQSDFRDRFDKSQPWEGDDEWLSDLESDAARRKRLAERDGKITQKERNQIARANRKFRAATNSYQRDQRREKNQAAPGGDAAFDQSAYDLMFSLLQQYNLGSLGKKLKELVQDGVTDQASLTLALQDTNEWKQRFIGNEKLKGQGLPVLSVAEYLATERSYAQIMKNYGLPEGFYDDPADFGGFIGNAVSASELQERVQSYSDLANREDPAIKAQLRAMGMSEGDLLAFMMDPERANPLIQKKYKTALIGGAARRTGLTPDTDYAEKLAGMGVSEEQAQAGYAVISENLDDAKRLGDIYGTEYGQRDFEKEVFEGDGDATRKRKRLASQERAAFSGESGVRQGSLTRDNSGQY